MTISSLGWARRILSGAVCLFGLALVLAKTHGGDSPEARHAGGVAAVAFVISMIALIEVARRESAEAERAAAERERHAFELLRAQFLRPQRARAVERAPAAPGSSSSEAPEPDTSLLE